MKIVKLGEVVDLFNGSTPLKTNKNYWANGDVPWFTVDDLRKQGKYITYTEKFITKLGLKESSVSLIPENAVLLCCTASVGAIAINKIRLTTNQQFNALVVKNSDQLLVEYLYYWFLANMDTLKSLGRATTIDYVSMSKLKDMALQLPSLEKQRQLVEKLDRAFTEIDVLEGNLEQSDVKFSQFMQSLLSVAFTFNVVNDEPSDSSAKGSLEMKLVPLKDICTVFGDGDWIESKDQSNEGIRLIQTGNVGSGVFKDRIEKARWISEDTFKRLRCTEISEGDVLISRLPDPVGRACLLPTLEHKAITAVDCSIVRFDANKMDSKFFVYYSLSSEYASAIEPLISGSTRQRISREKLGTVQIPLPSLEKQRKIVEKLDSAFAEIDLLKAQIKIEKDYAAALRQSLLNSAFTQEASVA